MTARISNLSASWFDRTLRLATGLATMRGGGLLTTFAFHRVLAKPCAIMHGEHDVQSFSRTLGWIVRQYQVLDPLQACERLARNDLPKRAAVITFDDGYRSNFDAGLPVLRAHRVQAAFFIATGFTQGGAMFNDRVVNALAHTTVPNLYLPWLPGPPLAMSNASDRCLASKRIIDALVLCAPDERDERVLALEAACGVPGPERLMMNADELRRLVAAGMTLGGHTRNHPVLTSLDATAARREIAQGRDDLYALTGERPTLFAYPNGRSGRDYTAEHCRMVERAGFAHAFTTDFGVSSSCTDRYRLRRVVAWRAPRVRFGLGALSLSLHAKER